MFEGDGAQWEMFVQQARELLLSSRADLLLLEQQGTSVGQQVLERLIRIFHSIGSLSNFFKLTQISEILEQMEAILTIWNEQPSLIDTASTAALDAAFWILHQSFTLEISRSETPILQEQINILRDVLANATWKGAHQYLGTTPPFDLHDYPQDVAVAVAEGRHMFALHFPLPRTEQQHQLNQLLEQLITVGELVTSIPQMSSDFALENNAKAFSVWLLFSTHLQQDLLMELTKLSIDNLIQLPLPEMMMVAQATAQAVEQPREKKFTELVLQTLQSHLEKIAPIPQAPREPEVGVTFEERKAEMELLALEMGQTNFRERSWVQLNKTILSIILSICVSVILALWGWHNTTNLNNNHDAPLPEVKHNIVQNEVLRARQEESIIPPVTTISQTITTRQEVTTRQEEHTAPVIKQDITSESVSTVVVLPTPSINPSISPQGESGRLIQIAREAGTPFTTIVAPPDVPQGNLRFIYNCNDSITFSIATLLNQTISRKGERLLISREMFRNIKLFLRNTKDTKGKAIIFDFDTTGQVTVSPSTWKAFIKKGSGVITVSHVFERKNGVFMIRDITALVANNIPKQTSDQRKKMCQQ